MAETLEKQFYEELKKGNTKKALYIVKLMGGDINVLFRGKSALVWAKKFENEEVIKALKEKGGIEDNISDDVAEVYGSKLVRAVVQHNYDDMDKWINKGANVNSLYFDKTALMEACIGGYLDFVQKLIEAGADVNLVISDLDGVKKFSAMVFACLQCNVEIMQELIKANADVNVKDEFGRTPLMLASFYGNIELVDLLIKNGANVNEKDQYGSTALMKAAMGEHVDVVECLVEHGAFVDEAYVDGKTALMVAASFGRAEVVKKLIELGANIYKKEKNGNNAIKLAKDDATRLEIMEAYKKKKQKDKKNKPNIIDRFKNIFNRE